MLHNERELFEQVILRTSDALGIEAGIVEKDYFVTLFLKHLVQKQPDLIFKGGTSLSKCFKLIQRFSEDIDLNIQGNTKPTEGQHRKIRDNIVSTIEELEFTLKNPEEIRSRRDFNQYQITYSTAFGVAHLKPVLLVETAFFFRAYPTQRMEAGSFVYDYLHANGFDDLVKTHGLEPFEVNVQSAERTLVDKLFALCDYYLSGKITEHSRHVYDIYKLLDVVTIDVDLKELAKVVREERKRNKTCLSAKDKVDVNAVLQEIIAKKIYKVDYEEITKGLLFEDIAYDEAIKAVQRVIDNGLL